MPEHPDPKKTARGQPPSGPAPRRIAIPQRPAIPHDVRGYSRKDVAAEPLQAPPPYHGMHIDALEKGSRLSPDVFASLGTPNAGLIKYIRAVITSYPDPIREDDRIGGKLKTESGQPATKDRIAGSILFVQNFLQTATFCGELGEERLEALLLYCGGEMNRLFLLTNAPLPRLGEIEPGIYTQLTAARSIKLSAPGKRDLYLFLAPLGIEKTLAGICRKHPATDSLLTNVEELRLIAVEGGSEPGATDLPAISSRRPKEPEFLRGSSPFPARAEDASGRLHNSLGIRPDQLRGMRRVDNPRARELFGGHEVALVQPGVEGMRLIVTPAHPSSIVDRGAEQIGYIDPNAYMEVIDRKGRRLYYIRVRESESQVGFAIGSLDDTVRILGEGAPDEAAEAVAARVSPEADRRISEIHNAVRENVARFPGARWSPEDEVHFGEGGRHIAILFSSGGKLYLITDGNWDDARRKMEEHLYASGQDSPLIEGSSFGKRTATLSSGEAITITIKNVRKAGVAAELAAQTLPMIPRHVLEAAGAVGPKESQEDEMRHILTAELLRGAELLHRSLSDSREMPPVLFEPDSLREVKPDPNRWYLILKSEEGKEYALFRFPCDPQALNPLIKAMRTASVFTNRRHPGFSFVLIEARFLSPELTEMLLGSWHAP